MTSFGLSESQLQKLILWMKSYSNIVSVKIFGSRSLGTFKEGSDIDIVIFGPKINQNQLRKMRIDYESLNLPFQLDLIHYESVTNNDLKVHIDQNSVSLI